MVYDYQTPEYIAGQLLEQAAARIGMTTAEMTELLESELEIDHVLAYIDALVSKRMN